MAKDVKRASKGSVPFAMRLERTVDVKRRRGRKGREERELRL